MIDRNHIDLARIEQARNDLAWVLPVLRGAGALWHRTSIDSLRGILRCGAIQPNDGRFPATYPQSNSCYGRHINSVCLFDFDTEPLDEILLHAFKWAAFLQDRGSATVLVRIDREALEAAQLVLSSKVRGANMPRIERPDEDGGAYVPTLIPRVEAWYRGPIDVQHFREYVVVRKREHRYVQLPAGASAFEEIERLGREWAAADTKFEESDPWTATIRRLTAARERQTRRD